ncbi:MAG: hypothetical protein HYZ28_19430 [Myxococcales bacterium]|nr:hypothetical protein [Myxococcales bacterium]
MSTRALALAIVWASAARAAAPTVAMNGHLPSASDSAAMAALGARAVRMDFNWFDFQPASGAFSFGYLDPLVQAARANNLAIYATVAYTPKWASSDPNCVLGASDATTRCENKRPASTADWTAAVTAVVARYKGQVECWGIWNEPNLRVFFDGTEDDFVNEIFVPAAAAVRAADPSGKICGPELAGLTTSSNWSGKKGQCVAGSCIRNGWEIDLANLLTRVGGQIDIVTHHVYKGDAPGVMTALIDGEYFGSLLTHDAVRRVVDSNGGAGKEFWLTETGWEHQPQGSYTDAQVASRIVDLFAKQEEVCAGSYSASTSDPWKNWTRTYYYHFPYDPGSGWGILDSALAPKQAYTALQSWASARTATACTGPSGATDAGTPDAGKPDAGTVSDAGAPQDAGAPVDAGLVADAGAPEDGGASFDAGDPGPADAGQSDAGGGSPAETQDAGTGAVAYGDGAEGGCGCGAAPSLSLLPALLAMVALKRRCRRAHR